MAEIITYPMRSDHEVMDLIAKLVTAGVQFAYTPHNRTVSYHNAPFKREGAQAS